MIVNRLAALHPKQNQTGAVQRLRRWLRFEDPARQYLADATDLADLERRMRALERASGGPAIVTFNH